MLLLVILIALVISAVIYVTRNTDQATLNLDTPTRLTSGASSNLAVSIDAEVAINAAEVFITYDPSLIEVTEIDKTGSIFTLWIKDQPSYDNRTGLLSLAGGLPTPGWQGSNGLLANIKYRTKGSGRAEFSLKPETRALANDGQGSSVSLTKPKLSLEISE